MENYYKVLEVDQDSSLDEIKSQYRFLVKAWHPDRFSKDDQKKKAERKLKEINKAYNVLSDPKKREEYDRRLSYGVSTPDPVKSTQAYTASSGASSSSGSRCQACGQIGPTRKIKFHENIGMMIRRKFKTIDAILCKNCINHFFWTLTGRTMLLGWWGTISFFVSIYILLNNLFRYIFTLGMGKPKRNIIESASPFWILSTVGGYLAIGYFLFSIFSPAAAQGSKPSSASYSPTRTPIPTKTSRSIDYSTSTPQSTPVVSMANIHCIHWSEVEKSMLGEEICVYGRAYDIYSTGQASTRIKFSSKPNTFFIYNANYIYPDLEEGDCVVAEEVLQLFQNKIPFMEINELYHCEPWME